MSRLQAALVRSLQAKGIVSSPAVAHALSAIDRVRYVPVALRNQVDVVYHDAPLPIGYSATISAPHMHAMVLEELYRTPRFTLFTTPFRTLFMFCSLLDVLSIAFFIVIY